MCFQVENGSDERWVLLAEDDGALRFLLASVLERFLGLYASINSFSQLVLSTQQREDVVKTWPPRAGEQIVL